MSQAIKCIYINWNIGCGNETIKFVITTKFLGALIDNNISSVCINRCSSACFAMVAVTGLMTTDTLCFHFTMSFWVSVWGSGATYQAARTSLLLKENHYNICTFKEKSLVGNYVYDSLHLTLAVITYSRCR